MWCRSKLELKFEVNEWSKELGKLEETEKKNENKTPHERCGFIYFNVI